MVELQTFDSVNRFAMVFLILVSSMSENPSVPVVDRTRSFFAGAAAAGGAASVVTFGAGETGTGTSKTGAGRKPLFFMYFSTSLRNEKAESSVEFNDKMSFQLKFLLHFLDNLIFKARSPNKNERESKTYQRTIRRDQRKNFKHERKFSLPRSLSIDVNGPLPFQNSAVRPCCGNFTNIKLVQF